MNNIHVHGTQGSDNVSTAYDRRSSPNTIQTSMTAGPIAMAASVLGAMEPTARPSALHTCQHVHAIQTYMQQP